MNYGRYQIISEIGKGSMGVVYKAHDPQIDRMIALKVLRHDRVADTSLTQRFLAEARAIGRLAHPNIVTVFDVGQDQGTIYIAMEFLEGNHLAHLIQEGPLDAREAVQIGIQVAEAIHYAHQQGIVHRDIKPANIIITSQGQIKVTDFGIARIEGASGYQQTQIGDILGTPFYMSPEQVAGQPVDGRSDIYSLGVVLYELATGRRPFGGEGLATLFRTIAEQRPEEPARILSGIPPRLSQLIMTCLEKKPEDRFPRGRLLAEALGTCLTADSGPPPSLKGVKRKKKRAGLVAASLTLCALVAAAGVYFYRIGIAPQAPERQASKPEPSVKLEPLRSEKTTAPSKAKVNAGTTPEPAPVKEKAHTGSALKVQPTDTSSKTIPPKKQPQAPKKPSPTTPAKQAAQSGAPLDLKPLNGVKPEPPKPSTLPRVSPTAPGTSGKMARIKPETASAGGGVKKAPIVDAAREKEPAEKIMRGALKVDSKPSGARFYVDGQLKGQTPLRIKLPYGKYHLRLNKDNFYEWEAQVELKQPKEIPLRIPLAPVN